jgi:hypothetical protein
MPHITLAVTLPVLQQIAGGHAYQRQLAIQGASPDIRAAIDAASTTNRVPINIAGGITLTVGDTGAIWGGASTSRCTNRGLHELVRVARPAPRASRNIHVVRLNPALHPDR